MKPFLAILIILTIGSINISHSFHCRTITKLSQFYRFSKVHKSDLEKLSTYTGDKSEIVAAKSDTEKMLNEMNEIFALHNGCQNKKKKNMLCTLTETKINDVKTRTSNFDKQFSPLLKSLIAIFKKIET